MYDSYGENKFAMRVFLHKRRKLYARIHRYKHVKHGLCRRIVEEDRSRVLRDLVQFDRIWLRNRSVPELVCGDHASMSVCVSSKCTSPP